MTEEHPHTTEDTAAVDEVATFEEAADQDAAAAPVQDDAPPARGWDDTLSYLEKVDLDAYKHAKGLRADYTRKTQALAAERKEMQARAEMLQQ